MRIAICDDQKNERQKVIEVLGSVIDHFSTNEFDNGSALLESHAKQLEKDYFHIV